MTAPTNVNAIPIAATTEFTSDDITQVRVMLDAYFARQELEMDAYCARLECGIDCIFDCLHARLHQSSNSDAGFDDSKFDDDAYVDDEEIGYDKGQRNAVC